MNNGTAAMMNEFIDENIACAIKLNGMCAMYRMTNVLAMPSEVAIGMPRPHRSRNSSSKVILMTSPPSLHG